jgi:hypothetical protein
MILIVLDYNLHSSNKRVKKKNEELMERLSSLSAKQNESSLQFETKQFEKKFLL